MERYVIDQLLFTKLQAKAFKFGSRDFLVPELSGKKVILIQLEYIQNVVTTITHFFPRKGNSHD